MIRLIAIVLLSIIITPADAHAIFGAIIGSLLGNIFGGVAGSVIGGIAGGLLLNKVFGLDKVKTPELPSLPPPVDTQAKENTRRQSKIESNRQGRDYFDITRTGFGLNTNSWGP